MNENNVELKTVSLSAEDLLLLENARKAQTEASSNDDVIENELDNTETDEFDNDDADDADDFDEELYEDDYDSDDELEDEDVEDPASKIELSLSDVQVKDETDELDYLFVDEEAKVEAKTTEAQADETDKVQATLTSGELPKHLQAGAPEYFRAIKTYAEGKVREALGVGGDGEPIEYEPFDDDHRIMFDHFVSEGKKLVSVEGEKIKSETKVKKLYSDASAKVDAILSTPELGDKYVAICENMKVKDKKKLDAAVANGDYSGYIALAERVKRTYSKANDVREKSKTKRLAKPKTKSLDDSLSFMGLS